MQCVMKGGGGGVGDVCLCGRAYTVSFLVLHSVSLDQIHNKRVGMGLLEYQAMPLLRDLAYDGVLCTFSNRSAPNRVKLRGLSGQATRTVLRRQNHTLPGPLSSRRPGGPPCWASPSLRPHCSKPIKLLDLPKT